MFAKGVTKNFQSSFRKHFPELANLGKYFQELYCNFIVSFCYQCDIKSYSQAWESISISFQA
jgi:hypothetical protein